MVDKISSLAMGPCIYSRNNCIIVYRWKDDKVKGSLFNLCVRMDVAYGVPFVPKFKIDAYIINQPLIYCAC